MSFTIEVNSLIGIGMVEYLESIGFKVVSYLVDPGGDFLDYITIEDSNGSLPKVIEQRILDCGIHRDQFKIIMN